MPAPPIQSSPATPTGIRFRLGSNTKTRVFGIGLPIGTRFPGFFGEHLWTVLHTAASVGPYSLNRWAWGTSSQGRSTSSAEQVSPPTIASLSVDNSPGLACSSIKPYKVGTHSKRVISYFWIRCERRVRLDLSGPGITTSVPPWQRVPRMPARELSKENDESSRNLAAPS